MSKRVSLKQWSEAWFESVARGWKSSRLFKACLGVLLLTPLFYLLLGQIQFPGQAGPRISLSVKTPEANIFQLFFDTGRGFNEIESVVFTTAASADYQPVTFSLPAAVKILHVRIDPGGYAARHIFLRSLQVHGESARMSWTAPQLKQYLVPNPQIADFAVQGDAVAFQCIGGDPILTLNAEGDAMVCQVLAQSGNSFGFRQWLWLLMLDGFVFCILVFRSSPLAITEAPKWNLAERGLVVLFLTLILLPLTGLALSLPLDISTAEKRDLASKPVFSLKTVFEYPASFQAYFNDHFSGRNRLVRWYNLLRIRCGAKVINRILVGKNGWLFLNLRRDYPARSQQEAYTPAKLENLLRSLQEQKAWLAARGIRYYVFFAHGKTSIYPEYLPEHYITVPREFRVQEVMPYLKAHGVDWVADPGPALQEAKARFQVYHQVDSHWNAMGGFIGYRVLLQTMQKDYPDLRPLELSDLASVFLPDQPAIHQDLAAMLNTQGCWKDTIVKLAILKPPRPALEAGKVLVLHDSMEADMDPFLIAHFPDRVLIHHQFQSLTAHHAEIEAVKPKVVIFEIAEMGFDKLRDH